MIDHKTIPSLRKVSTLFMLGWAVFGTGITLLLVVCALLMQAALFLLQVINTTAHEFERLYSLQPPLLQLVLFVSLVVLSFWFLARAWRSLIRAGAYIKQVSLDELYRMYTRGARYGR